MTKKKKKKVSYESTIHMITYAPRKKKVEDAQ
jgi:hypothetical protein